MSVPAPVTALFPFTCDANSSSSIFVIYSPGTQTKPKYLAVMFLTTLFAVILAAFDDAEGMRYSCVCCRIILRSYSKIVSSVLVTSCKTDQLERI